MTFEEIFNEKGLYVADGFEKGFCFKINEDGVLKYLFYKNINDFNPIEGNGVMYKGLLNKTYRKIFNRQYLFK